MVSAPAGKAQEKEPSDGFVELVISGAAEPVPALQYRLLPPIEELKPGNAAIDWFKLCDTVPADIDDRHKTMEDGPTYDELLYDIPFDKIKNEYLDYADSFYKVSSSSFLKHAANCLSCDWQDHYEDGINMMLPGLSKMKYIAKYVALEARVEAAKGNYVGALELLSYNYSMAEDLGKGNTIIQNLVGIGIAGLNYKVVEDIVSQPDSPNLFWAIQLMPSPLIDIKQACEAEMKMWLNNYVDGLDTSILSVEQANKRFNELWQDAYDDLPFSVIIAAKYTQAKQYLLEHGYSPEWLEQIPTAQVVMLWMWQDYIPIRDEYFKYIFVPYCKGEKYFDNVTKQIDAKHSSLTDDNIFLDFLPAISKVSLLATRIEVRADALQCVEAIRMYVAEYGKLPEKLADIDFIPLPENELTGEKFRYYLDGDSAVLDIEDPEDDYDFQGYRLRLR